MCCYFCCCFNHAVNKHDYDETVQLSIPYHCDNATSSPVLIPVYLASANPMTQRNSTDIHALTNMHIPTAMSHVCLCCHTIADSRQQINISLLPQCIIIIGCFANWHHRYCIRLQTYILFMLIGTQSNVA